MRRRSRTWQLLKWVGTALCLLFLAAFLLSGLYVIDLQHGRAYVGIGCGRICVTDVSRYRQHYFRCDVTRHTYGFCFWDAVQMGLAPVNITVPLWAIFAVTAVPTALLWWRDRRVPPGHCSHCSYNLTGNVSGRCPECGQAIGPDGEATDVNG